MLDLKKLESIDCNGKTFVFDKSIRMFKVGGKYIFLDEYEQLGWPYYDDAIGETDPDNPIVKAVLDSGGNVRNNISGKTDYYVVGEPHDDSTRDRDYATQKEKGKQIAAISLSNLKQLLGVDFSGSEGEKLEFIEIYDPEVDTISSPDFDGIPVEETEISGDSASDWEYTMVGGSIGEPEELLLLDYLGNEEIITIPSVINGEPVHLTPSSRFENSKAKVVRIPGSFKIIPSGMLRNNLAIKEVFVGTGVEEIESDFCLFASNLRSVHLPSSIKRVGKSVFYGTEWSNAQGDEVIAGGVLLHKYAAENWTIDDGTYVVPDGVSCIAMWAFFNAYEKGKEDPFYVKRVELPASVRYISEEAFFNLGIETIRIPSTIEYVGPRAFQGTGILANYEQMLQEKFVIIGDFLYEILEYSQSVVIPDCIRLIGEGNNVLNTNKYEMTELLMPDSVEEIWKMSFSGCKNLSRIQISNRLKVIGDDSFAMCEQLKHIELPDSLERIGAFAFSGSGLEEISIPGTVKKVDEYSFARCKEVTEVRLCEGIEEISNHSFEDCESLEIVYLPSTLKRIGYNAFKDCKSLTEINIPESVEFIADNAFDGCKSLERE